MKFNIGDNFDDKGEYELELEMKDIGDDDSRNELIPQLIMTTMQAINEYVQKIPVNNSYERDEDGCISVNDLNKCMDEFRTEHLDKFLDLLKNDIQTIHFSN